MANKGGRPRKKIDKGSFENLCGLQCTLAEIASFFDCCEDTIENWCKRTYTDEETGEPMGFSEVFKKHSGTGKISLRRYQFRLAENNTAMAIFLGKNYLGQRDSFATEVSGDGMLGQLIEGLKIPKEE